ncbi:MAG: hemerythrin [Alphaproteobacteria bacterium]|nr:hemerythrin [Alphaproteobacteria bacterium]MBF0249385.1 hemerythrin [Alphaproteobacteria bacterium]
MSTPHIHEDPLLDTPPPLLKWSEEHLALGVGVMDGYHREFISIQNALTFVPKSVFAPLLKELVRHTQEHFAHEELLMKETDFPAFWEHRGEHNRLLGELKAMLMRAERGSLVLPREFINSQLPEWFQLHLITMDSALAAHLKVTLNLK